MPLLRRTLLLLVGLLAAACTADGAPNRPGRPLAGPGAEADARPFGRTGPRRLSNSEYDNTVRDLLGTSQRLAANFVAEESAGFDNVAEGLGMTPSQYESYYSAAESLARELFADDARRERVVGCVPSGPDGGECLERFLRDFGARAFRRPLSHSLREGLRAAYARAIALGESELDALEHVTVVMLSSAPFLYRTEVQRSDAPDQTRPLDGYELASRLSYFLWSTLPDPELSELAESGELLEPTVLAAQVSRMLDHPNAEALIDDFASQWLGLRELAQHKVLSERFPTFDDLLRTSMLEEARAYVREFLSTDRPLSEFLSATVHFVNAQLARHYGIDEPAQEGLVRVDEPIGERRGFIGLAGFLTLSSFAHRTSPTLRAKWILEELLCSPVPPPPPDVAQLDGDPADVANMAAQLDEVRTRLELHRSDPKCAGCHALMDPIGLGLESFDGIGRARERYENGTPVETRGELPDGTRFSGPRQLSVVLAKDARFLRCATQKLLTYALQRSLEQDTALIEATVATLQQGGTLRGLIEAVVMSEAFRSQREAGGEE